MTVKEQLHEYIDDLSEEEAARLLEWLANDNDPDVLTDEEMDEVHEGLAQYARGETVNYREWKARLKD